MPGLNKTETRLVRMNMMGYVLVCVQQTAAAATDDRGTPSNSEDMLRRFRSEFDACWYMGREMFGEAPYDNAGEQLYEVEELTLKESAIAARMDLTHEEKLELVKPLRDKRRMDAEKRMARPYRPSKWEREYRERRKQEECNAPAEVVYSTFEQLLDAADAMRARGWGIFLA